MRIKKGFTLIEVLITLALLSLVGLLFFSIFGQGIRLYAEQSDSANELTSLRQVLSDITNNARITDSESIEYTSGVLHIGDNLYNLTGNAVKKNGVTIANDIATFEVNINGGILEITIVNLSGKSISSSISLLG